MLLFGNQLVPTIQHRLDLTQRFFQPVDFGLHVAQGFAVTDHLADVAEGAFHLIAFAGREVDTNGAFQIFEYLEIGHLHFAPGFVIFLLLIKFRRFIKALLNIFNKRRIVGCRPHAGAKEQTKQKHQKGTGNSHLAYRLKYK